MAQNIKPRLYQPSNASEGMSFENKFCYQCKHMDPNPEGKKHCENLCNTLVFSITDKEYPKEWCYNEADEPCCTKWENWDWDKYGDPDKPNNNAPISVGPNQINLF